MNRGSVIQQQKAAGGAPTFALASSASVACRTTPFSMIVAASSSHTCTAQHGASGRQQ
jgi:hypothetical protein